MSTTTKPHTDQNGIIGEELRKVKQQLYEKTHIKPQDDFTSGILNHKNLFKGKLIRPTLVLLSAKLTNPAGHVSCNPITVKTATIIELLHNATLLHDDVIDQGKTRRKNQTLNFLKGDQTAVLAGDFLLTRVFNMCSELPASVTKIIAQAASRTCKGEIMQIARSGDWGLCEEEYLRIIADKTAALFFACCRLGAITEQKNSKIQQKLGEIGEDIGMAYQLTDDLLDITGTEESEGKTLGTDTANNKPTLPVIHFLRKLDKKQRAAFLDKLKSSSDPRKFMVSELSKSHSLDYTYRKVFSYIDTAINRLDKFQNCPAKTEVKKICTQILEKVGQASLIDN